MTTDPEIIRRLDRIEKLLSLLVPETQPVAQEVRIVAAQGGDIAQHYRDKFRQQSKKEGRKK